MQLTLLFPQLYFENKIEKEKYSGHLYGIGAFASSAANFTNSNGGTTYTDYDSNDAVGQRNST